MRPSSFSSNHRVKDRSNIRGAHIWVCFSSSARLPCDCSLELLGMLHQSFSFHLLSLNCPKNCFSAPDLGAASPTVLPCSTTFCSSSFPHKVRRGISTFHLSPKKWNIRSTVHIEDIALDDEGQKSWEACRQALSAFGFSIEEEDKILGKAFGHIRSPYWSEERKKETPRVENISATLDYLRSLGLSNGDLCKLLKKFPEVLGCSLEDELTTNVQILAKDWGIEGKTLTKLLLRNPKVLGYNVDCKGDCVAKCTRCWVRF